MLNIRERFLRLISNNFQSDSGVSEATDAFLLGRLPSLLSSSERKMRENLPLERYKEFKQAVTEEVTLIIDDLVKFSTTTDYEADDKVVLYATYNDEIVEFQSLVMENNEGTVKLYQNVDEVEAYLSDDIENYTFYIEPDIKYSLSNAVIYMTASDSLHQLMSISKDEGMNISVNLGSGNLTKLTTSNITDVKNYYKSQYYSAISQYQEDGVGGISITMI